MATYAIGDIQGCFDEFCLLLEKIEFNPAQDTLWLAGDIVSRGPKSLEMLEYAYAHQAHCKIVLGNHDLHLLACYYSHKKTKPKEKLESLLQAEGVDNLLNWLRKQPMVLYDEKLDFLMTHAGVPAAWDLEQSLQNAQLLEQVLRNKSSAVEFFKVMYGNQPDQWQANLQGHDRLRYITNGLTRMRFCSEDGGLDFADKCAPKTLAKQQKKLLPWYQLDLAVTKQTRLLFGHWATLEGELQGASPAIKEKIFPLDTGCIWGGNLTALRLEDLQSFSVKALGSQSSQQNPLPIAIK